MSKLPLLVERHVIRDYGRLLISPDMLPNQDGNNINGASLIKVPDWIENPLGKYYLYFAHHAGKYIRMAYSNNADGDTYTLNNQKYTVYEKGTLKLDETPGHDHIASPDVHIDNERKEIVMYYHTPYKDWQYTFKATSKDGINFISDDKPLGMFYFRVFKWKDRTFSIAKNKNISGISYELIGDDWIAQKEDFIPMMRHAAVLVEDEKVYVFYTVVGEAPESIYCSELDIDNGWELKNTEKILTPTYQCEGSHLPLIASRFGSTVNVNELRDPCIFVDDYQKYILYSTMGESGIAIAKLHNVNSDTKKYDIWGMRRVGNHAITEWISSHFNNTIHYNDIVNKKPWRIKQYETGFKGNDVDLIVNSYEDFEPEEVNENTIILLRDWYNMSASRLVSNRGWDKSCRYPNKSNYDRSCAEVYLKYCKLWEKHPDNFILYNKWTTDENYEIEIEKRYGWNRTPRLNKLPTSGIGDGSSFDIGLSKMNERYSEIATKYPNEWKLIISNEEINHYTKLIFGIDVKELNI